MGNFYTNIVLKGASCVAVTDSLVRLQREAFVASVKSDITVIYDAEGDGQDQDVLSKLASNLSRELKCVGWTVLNHDDDILWYRLYSVGDLVDEYNSTPGAFDPNAESSAPAGGNAAELANAFGCPTATQSIEAILRESTFEDNDIVFAINRHRALAEAMGLPFDLLPFGYKFIEDGDTSDVAPESFVRISN